MQQYHRLVCERRQEAAARNQALQREARRTYASLSVAVDTSKLDALKTEYQSAVASLYPHWQSSHVSTHSQDHRLTYRTADHPAAFSPQHTETLPSLPSRPEAATIQPREPPSVTVQVPSQPTDTDSVPRPQNSLVLSIEGSESSNSLTPPLADSDRETPRQPNNAEQPHLPSSERDKPYNIPAYSSESQPVSHSIGPAKSSDEASLNERHPHLEDSHPHEGAQVDAEEDNSSAEEGGSVKQDELGGETENIDDRGRGTDATGDNAGLPVEEKAEEHFFSDKSESSSFGDERGLPLPLEVPLKPPPPPQRDSGGSNKESNSISVELGGVEGSGGDMERPTSSQDGKQTTEQTATHTQSGADAAYASFLQSVRQTATATAAAPLLDSDSEGIEDVVAGREKHPGPHSRSQSSAPLPTTSAAAGATESGKVGTHQAPKTRSWSERVCGEGKGEEVLGPSGTEASQSPPKPGYTPSIIDKQQAGEESKTLQKRLGFWGSDSSLDSSGIEPPTAEDDQGDFDFYM